MAIYRGIAFPMKKSSAGIPAPVEDAELIKQSIVQIITTQIGERVHQRAFGSQAYSIVFEGDTDEVRKRVRHICGSSIGRYEPRIVVQSIQYELRTQDDSSVIHEVSVSYVIPSLNKVDSVTLEF